MQSKQKKQHKGKAVKRTPRTEKKQTARKRTSRRQESANTAVVRAPLNTAMVRDLAYGLHFAKAPPHDRYPSGGLRISGLLPAGDYVDSPEANEYTYGVMYADTGDTGYTGACLINPCNTDEKYSAHLFGTGSPVPAFAGYFSQFRFDALELVWTSKVPPSSSAQGAGNLSMQVAYEPDPLVCWANAFVDQTFTTTSTSCTRFPAWTPEVRIPIIKPNSRRSDDQLFYTTQDGDNFDMTGGQASARQIWQGGFYMSSDVKLSASIPDAPVTLARIMVRFVVDLYGFRSDNGTGLPSHLGVPRQPKKVEESKDDRKSSEPSKERDEVFVVVPEVAKQSPASRAPSLKGTKA